MTTQGHEEALAELGITQEQAEAATVEDDAPEQVMEEAPQEEQTDDQSREEPKEKPEGWDRVDFHNDPPDKIEARFNRLYGQMKHLDDVSRQLMEDNKKLIERQSKVEKTQRDSHRNQELAETENLIAQALEQGDTKEAARLMTYSAKLQAQPAEPQDIRPEAEQGNRPYDGGNNSDTAIASAWQFETDTTGNYVRPWAHEGHPMNQRAMQIAETVIKELNGLPVMTQLREIDKRVNAEQRPKTSPVLNGNTDARPGPKKGPQLSDVQKSVARNMFPDLKPNDAYKKYADGME